MEKMDCLFIHVPKFNSFYKPFNEFMCINYLPMGVMALADLLSKEGYNSRIVNLGIEWIIDKNFSIISYLKNKNVNLIAMDLHWHYQAYDVIEVSKKIKSLFPEIFLILGGYTASFFDREIMANFLHIDGIIRGEGEVPILSLMKSQIKERKLHHVPNLIWRDGQGSIIRNEITYVATEDELNRLNFTNFSLLDNYQTYIKYLGIPFAWIKNLSKEDNYRYYTMRSPFFCLPVGRGCTGECSWCGGGSNAQRLINQRERVIFRSHEKVMESIMEAKEYGYETIHTCFDPHPYGQDYYIQLFKMIRNRKLRIDFYFECFGLPTEQFLDEFSKTFPGRNSIIAISPESGSEKVRRTNKSFFYSNQELFDTLQRMEKKA